MLEFRPAYLDSSKSDSRAPSQNASRERFSFRFVLKTVLGAPRVLFDVISDSRAPSQNAPRERFSFRFVLKTMLGAQRVLFNEIYHISFYIPGILI